MFGQKWLYAQTIGNPVPSKHQRKIRHYSPDVKRCEGNSKYGDFQAPGLKWPGKSCLTTRQLYEQRELRIGNIKKRSIEAATNQGHEGYNNTVIRSLSSFTIENFLQFQASYVTAPPSDT